MKTKKQCIQKWEKIGLGDNFRKNRTRKIKEVVKSKSLKKQRPKKSKEPNVHKQGKPKTANERS